MTPLLMVAFNEVTNGYIAAIGARSRCYDIMFDESVDMDIRDRAGKNYAVADNAIAEYNASLTRLFNA